jgi:hypothetical protein
MWSAAARANTSGQRYLMGAIADGNPLIRPTLFKAQTIMWGLFDAYDIFDACGEAQSSLL